MARQIRKILVIKLRAIGDVVLSTAVLPDLRREFPAAVIHFLVEDAAFPIVDRHPSLDAAIRLPKKEWKTMPFWKSWIDQVRTVWTLRRTGYDLVIDLFGNPRSALLTWLTNAPMRVGYAFRGRRFAYTKKVEPRSDQVHEVEFHRDALRALSIPVGGQGPSVPLKTSDVKRMDRWLHENGMNRSFLVGFHVWGGWEAKRWPLDRFADLADRLGDAFDATVILVWGPGERQYAETVLKRTRTSAILAPETTLGEMAALLSRCRMVVANDSGPMHIAAALGTPTVGIFGPTQWRLQGPYGAMHRIVACDGLVCLGCNRLSCSHLTCMKDLDVERVFKTVRSVAGTVGPAHVRTKTGMAR